MAAVTIAPSTPPYSTSSVVWTRASIRVCATSSAIMKTSVETSTWFWLDCVMKVTAAQPPNATAAWPDGRPEAACLFEPGLDGDHG